MPFDPKNIVVVGASGAIGQAFVTLLSRQYPEAQLHAFSRQDHQFIDYQEEDSIAEAARLASQDAPLDCVIVANGILHDIQTQPEKSLKDCRAENFHHVFQVNTIVPSLVAKHFLPKLNSQEPSRFAVLSARVGSISDNQLGGWYAYRASKAALNMIVKTAAIELARKNKQAILLALHPGTVDSNLSKPFQAAVPEGKLFTPEYSVQHLIQVLAHAKPEDSGKCFDYAGQEILP